MRKELLLAIIFVFPLLGIAQEPKTIRDSVKLYVGDRYAELVLPNEKDEIIKLSDYCGRGHYTLLIFEKPFLCSVVHKDIPVLKELYKTYYPKGVEFIGINATWASSAIRDLISKYEIPWPQMGDFKWAPNGKERFCSDTYGIRFFPTYYLVNPEGIIVSLQVGSIRSRHTVHYKLRDIFNIKDDGIVDPESIKKSSPKQTGRWGRKNLVNGQMVHVIDITYHNGSCVFKPDYEYFTSAKSMSGCKSSKVIFERSTSDKFTIAVSSEFDMHEEMRQKNYIYLVGDRGRNADRGYPHTGEYKYDYQKVYTTYVITIKNDIPFLKIGEIQSKYYYNGTCTYSETFEDLDKAEPLNPY